jgi:hypothetical protein
LPRYLISINTLIKPSYILFTNRSGYDPSLISFIS